MMLDSDTDDEDDFFIPSELPYQPVSYSSPIPLTAFEARKYLEDSETPTVLSIPFKPKGGELFLVEVQEDYKRNYWQSCGHNFYQTKGAKPSIAGNSFNLIIRKTHNLRTKENSRPGTTEFQMISWYLQDNPNRTLVQFVGDETLSLDIEVNDKKKIYTCQQCDKVFEHYHPFWEHRRVVHEKRFVPCSLCDKVFKHRSSLLQHKKSEHGAKSTSEKKVYACMKCGKQFTENSSLKRHNTSVHEGKSISCNQCGKQFTQENSLKRHITSVHEGKCVSCDECDKQFSTLDNLRTHKIAAHEGVRHHCHFCDYRATRNDHLQHHIEKYHKAQWNKELSKYL